MKAQKLRLGVVNFLNAYPLFYGLESLTEVELIRDVPSRLCELLYREELDAALISSVEFYRNQKKYRFYPKLCIAATGKTESIRLYVGKDTSLRQVETLYADYASRSSVVLAKYILGPLQKKSIPKVEAVYPPYQNLLPKLNKNEALVVIGDEALKLRHIPSVDLGEVYHELTGRGFVYALWVYLPKTNEKKLHYVLNFAWEKAQKERDNLLKKASENFAFSFEFIQEYLLNTITYELKENLSQDMEFFFQEVHKYNL